MRAEVAQRLPGHRQAMAPTEHKHARSDAGVRSQSDAAVTADDLSKHHGRTLHANFFAYQESLITN